MRLLVTGASGQLGRAIARLPPDNTDIILKTRAELDIADAASIARNLDAAQPDAIVNAAAFTDVDRAESDRDQAFRANATGPRLLAEATSAAGIPLIHVSTDFVFDGTASRPYRPDDPTGPLNVYGASKLAGETAALDANADALVVRTSWLYGLDGRNFVTAILARLREGGRAEVVTDQLGSPTSVVNLARLLISAARHKISGGNIAGIRHFADDGVTSRFDFARAIRDEAVAAGLVDLSVSIEPAGSGANAPVRRPAYSALDSSDICAELDFGTTSWRTALAHSFRLFLYADASSLV
jgi:dTDP-4-dehydrorhamnose reductase